jgi:2',3'-cyclic-nucleotide 2'-phosphodiesterase
MNQFLESLTEKPEAIVVDFHAEATSEKQALGRYLDGRVTAVVGTHTHVGTIDARVLPRGTAFVSDIGMVGPSDSVIGDSVEDVLHRFLTHMPQRLTVATGAVTFNSVLVETEPGTGRAASITRIDREVG